jgi:uncharacterized membrane protein
MLVLYHGGLMFEQGVEGWGVSSIVMLAVVFLLFPLYDALAKSALGKDIRVMGAIGFVITACVIWGMVSWAGFSYRAYSIHTGVMFGMIMIMNVWMRIWPAQKKIIPAVKEGTPPDPALVARAAQRSRHNTYLSVPLVWTMINAHTVVPGANSPLWLLGVILVGWGGVSMIYAKSAKVKGM